MFPLLLLPDSFYVQYTTHTHTQNVRGKIRPQEQKKEAKFNFKTQNHFQWQWLYSRVSCSTPFCLSLSLDKIGVSRRRFARIGLNLSERLNAVRNGTAPLFGFVLLMLVVAAEIRHINISEDAYWVWVCGVDEVVFRSVGDITIRTHKVCPNVAHKCT